MVQRITISRDQLQDRVLSLDTAQVHYLYRVLRLQAGDRFIAQDGQGQQWLIALTAPAQSEIVSATVVETISTQSSSVPPLRLIAALPKGNSFDAVVRQVTELGVSEIYPVLSDRTLLKPSSHKVGRWQRIAQEAAEQSERTVVPKIFPPAAFQQCLMQLHPDEQLAETALLEHRFICSARENSPHLLARLQTQNASAELRAINLAIGPEGGWTPDEIAVASSAGYEVVSLGSAVLRAVTASVAAISLVTAARELLI